MRASARTGRAWYIYTLARLDTVSKPIAIITQSANASAVRHHDRQHEMGPRGDGFPRRV